MLDGNSDEDFDLGEDFDDEITGARVAQLRLFLVVFDAIAVADGIIRLPISLSMAVLLDVVFGSCCPSILFCSTGI